MKVTSLAESLVAGMRRLDQGGVEDSRALSPSELVESFTPFVLRTLKYHSVAERDLDDVCQEVFIVIFRRLPEFDRARPIRAWIYGICMKVAAAYRRRAHHRREVLVRDAPDEVAPGSTGPEVASTQQLVAMLARLDEDKRTVLILHEIEELPMNEIALIVDCPVKTAYSRLAAARKQMLVMMSKWNPRQ
jgi:RNA polymerase sigma-70 factor, ECF subfamily